MVVQTWNFLIVLIPLVMGTCNQAGADASQNASENKVFLNNKEIVIGDEDFQMLHKTLAELLNKCDDLYEQIVTDDLIDKIKSGENYLEVYYAKKMEVNIGNKQTLSIRKLIIPLSGKYQSDNELTFFCGIPEYTSTPYINSRGFDKLDKVLKNLQGE